MVASGLLGCVWSTGGREGGTKKGGRNPRRLGCRPRSVGLHPAEEAAGDGDWDLTPPASLLLHYKLTATRPAAAVVDMWEMLLLRIVLRRSLPAAALENGGMSWREFVKLSENYAAGFLLKSSSISLKTRVG